MKIHPKCIQFASITCSQPRKLYCSSSIFSFELERRDYHLADLEIEGHLKIWSIELRWFLSDYTLTQGSTVFGLPADSDGATRTHRTKTWESLTVGPHSEVWNRSTHWPPLTTLRTKTSLFQLKWNTGKCSYSWKRVGKFQENKILSFMTNNEVTITANIQLSFLSLPAAVNTGTA